MSHEISNHNSALLQCTVLNIPICKNQMGKRMYYFIYNNKRLTLQIIDFVVTERRCNVHSYFDQTLARTECNLELTYKTGILPLALLFSSLSSVAALAVAQMLRSAIMHQ